MTPHPSKLAPTLVVVLLLALNFHCWQPGIGGRTDRDSSGTAPRGAELEIHYGFPACYSAQLWRSDNPQHIGQLLAWAPFQTMPDAMQLAIAHTSYVAMVVDCLFAASAMGAVFACTSGRLGCHSGSIRASRWSLMLGLLAAICLSIAEGVSLHL